jgi:hypothetical protein
MRLPSMDDERKEKMWDRMRKLRHLVIATQLRLKNYFP